MPKPILYIYAYTHTPGVFQQCLEALILRGEPCMHRGSQAPCSACLQSKHRSKAAWLEKEVAIDLFLWPIYSFCRHDNLPRKQVSVIPVCPGHWRALYNERGLQFLTNLRTVHLGYRQRSNRLHVRLGRDIAVTGAPTALGR